MYDYGALGYQMEARGITGPPTYLPIISPTEITQVPLATIAALCDILDVTPNDLISTHAQDVPLDWEEPRGRPTDEELEAEHDRWSNDATVVRVIEEIVDLLVQGRYDEISHLDSAPDVDADYLRRQIEEHGVTLVGLPSGWNTVRDSCLILANDRFSPFTLHIEVRLHSVTEQHDNELMLFLQLEEMSPGHWRPLIEDLRESC